MISKGRDNRVADAFSRVLGSICMPKIPLEVSLSQVEYKAITYPYFGWLDELRREMENDDWIQNKMQEVISSQASNKHRHSASSQLSKFHIDDGFLKHKGRIVLSPSTTWKLKVLEQHHATPTTGIKGCSKFIRERKEAFIGLV